VEYLISRSADVNTFDIRGNQPISDAMLNGHGDIVDVLRQAGATLSPESDDNIQHKMCQLAAAENISEFQRLVKGGVSVDACDYDLRTPLHLAACRGNLELVKFIIANGGNVNFRDRWGRTAMADAIGEGHVHVQEALKLAQWLADTLSDSEACSEAGSIDDILDIAGPSHPRARSMSPGPRKMSLQSWRTASPPSRDCRGRSEDDLGLRFTTHCVEQVRRCDTTAAAAAASAATAATAAAAAAAAAESELAAICVQYAYATARIRMSRRCTARRVSSGGRRRRRLALDQASW
jgi:hypothetical protein